MLQAKWRHLQNDTVRLPEDHPRIIKLPEIVYGLPGLGMLLHQLFGCKGCL